MAEYAKLTDYSPKINSFTVDKLIDAASIDGSLKEWVAGYQEVYYDIKE